MKRTGPTNLAARRLIAELRKAASARKERLWKRVAEEIEKPRRIRAKANLSKLEKMAGVFPKKLLLVPGKVLAGGALKQSVIVAALEYSREARKKISGAGGKALGLKELLEKKTMASEIVIVK